MAACSNQSSCSLSIDDFNEVSLASQSVSPQWTTLAKRLKVSRSIVEGIELHRGGRDTVWCLDELLSAWLRQTSTAQPVPSWRLLCDAIAKIDRALSNKIWMKHTSRCDICSGAHQPGSTVQQHSTPTNQVTHSPSPLSTVTYTPATQHDGSSMTEAVVAVNTSVPVIHNDPLPPTPQAPVKPTQSSNKPPSSSSPTANEFAHALYRVPSWYNLGVFLDVSTTELDRISFEYSRAPEGTLRCLIEVYKSMEREGKPLSWKSIAEALRLMKNYSLADEIHSRYIKPRSTVQQHSTPTNQVTYSPSPLSTHYGSSMTEAVVAVNSSVPVIHNDPLPPTPQAQHGQHLTLNDHAKVYDLVKSLKTDWMELGIKLGILYDPDLQTIDQEQSNLDRKLMKMLSVWLRRAGGKVQPVPSWRILHDAVESFDRNIADTIDREYLSR